MPCLTFYHVIWGNHSQQHHALEGLLLICVCLLPNKAGRRIERFDQPARGGFLACANLLLIFFSSADLGSYFLIQISKSFISLTICFAKLLFKCFCFSWLFVFVFSLESESSGLPAPAHFRSRPHPVFGSASSVILFLHIHTKCWWFCTFQRSSYRMHLKDHFKS